VRKNSRAFPICPYRPVVRTVALDPRDHVFLRLQTAEDAHGCTQAHPLEAAVQAQPAYRLVGDVRSDNPQRVGLARPLESKDRQPGDLLGLAIFASAAKAV
jgi:hypothetical protein